MKALSQKRRHPLAAIALLLMGLLVTGGLYAVATTMNQAKASTTSFTEQDTEEGGKLFAKASVSGRDPEQVKRTRASTALGTP